MSCAFGWNGSGCACDARVMAKGKEKSARLQLLMTCPELTPEQIELIVADRNCRGDAVGDRPGIFCRIR
jgi:hypothetical protein